MPGLPPSPRGRGRADKNRPYFVLMSDTGQANLCQKARQASIWYRPDGSPQDPRLSKNYVQFGQLAAYVSMISGRALTCNSSQTIQQESRAPTFCALSRGREVPQPSPVHDKHITVAISSCAGDKVEDRAAHVQVVAHALQGDHFLGDDGLPGLATLVKLDDGGSHIAWEDWAVLVVTEK